MGRSHSCGIPADELGIKQHVPLLLALGRSLTKRPTNASFEQVYRKALKLSLNRGAVHQFSLLVHTVPVSVQLDQDEISMEVRV